jgi:pimeloyl-ACP methyl ester carboxylesterase
MSHVISNDGTKIAHERRGAGPALILIGGGLDDGSENAALIPFLETHFTVYNYARRGRGDSGDTAPYAVAREIEDIDALISDAAGPAHLFGVSSGGALALEAAAAGLAVDKVAVYEVPYTDDDAAAQRWADYVDRLTTALADGHRARALELFMRLAGSSDDDIAAARTSVFWPRLEALAPTLAYDAACLGDGRPPTSRLKTIHQPTLVATGTTPDPSMSGLQPGFFDEAADAIAAAVPHAERRIAEGQGHVAEPAVLARMLDRFLTT